MLKKVIFIGVLLSTILTHLSAKQLQIQTDTIIPKEVLGIGIEQPDMILELMPFIEGIGSNSRNMLREQSVKPYMMPPRATSDNGSPLAYVLATCLEYYININDNYKMNLSPEYISLIMNDKNHSAKITEGLKFLVSEGTVNAAIVPYNANTISSAVYGTQKHHIKNYLHIIRASSSKRFKILDTRKALIQGNPVIIEMEVDQAFINLKNENTWKPTSNNDKNKQTIPLIVVGFDESKEAFEILNVYGREWGKNGYIWIDYKDYVKYVRNAFVMMPN